MTEPAGGASRIEDISTRASALNDPAKLVLRYGRAVRKYLGALLPDGDADDDNPIPKVAPHQRTLRPGGRAHRSKSPCRVKRLGAWVTFTFAEFRGKLLNTG